MGCGSSKATAVAETTKASKRDQHSLKDPITLEPTQASSDRLHDHCNEWPRKQKSDLALTREELGYEPSNLPEADPIDEVSLQLRISGFPAKIPRAIFSISSILRSFAHLQRTISVRPSATYTVRTEVFSRQFYS
jgi:hypothetical protein